MSKSIFWSLDPNVTRAGEMVKGLGLEDRGGSGEGVREPSDKPPVGPVVDRRRTLGDVAGEVIENWVTRFGF